MIGQSTRSSEVVPFVLTATELEKFGLQVQDEPEIQAIAQRINAADPDTVYQFGRDVAENTAGYPANALAGAFRNQFQSSSSYSTSALVG